MCSIISVLILCYPIIIQRKIKKLFYMVYLKEMQLLTNTTFKNRFVTFKNRIHIIEICILDFNYNFFTISEIFLLGHKSTSIPRTPLETLPNFKCGCVLFIPIKCYIVTSPVKFKQLDYADSSPFVLSLLMNLLLREMLR